MIDLDAILKGTISAALAGVVLFTAYQLGLSASQESVEAWRLMAIEAMDLAGRCSSIREEVSDMAEALIP
jgi:hypothetical protein